MVPRADDGAMTAGQQFCNESYPRRVPRDQARTCHALRHMADLRFGTILAPSLMPLYEAVTSAVGERLGVTTELIAATSYENCINDDVCFVCSMPYVMYERERVSPAEPPGPPSATRGGRLPPGSLS